MDNIRKAIPKDSLSWQYPPIKPYLTGKVRVSDIHELYFEESGNPKGKPVVFLHGGPGSGTSAKQRQFFHPEKYRIILFDQRGCGKSTPSCCLIDNTTFFLIEDLEKLRNHLKVSKWQVFGGSWGSTLAIAYAEKYPEAVSELVLRGVFLLRKKEIDWLYQFGASEIFPDSWAIYDDFIPSDEKSDYVAAYHKRVNSSDPKLSLEAAKIWSMWEGSTSKLIPDADFISHYGDEEFAQAFAKIELHYFFNRGFFKKDNELMSEVERIRQIPAVIVQGRYDMVCPVDSAFALHNAWPESELIIVPDTGHSAFEYGNSRALVAATDKFAR